ncbi:MAG: hypothetical protein LBM98_06575 [Oscillospiraceae bacterium]|nr:hypothetical protein [Oscillospiraceae bacterium]
MCKCINEHCRGEARLARIARPTRPASLPRHCEPVLRGRRNAHIVEFRKSVTGAAIQCRERNIRICGLRHWIASHL